MKMKIGIPRALMYYHFYPLWHDFFKALGHDVIVSDFTNKKILEDGIDLCVDDACLPVKLCHGHINNLKQKVDIIFLPRIVSIAPKEYICPKFIGLPDMVKNNMKDLPDVIDIELNLYREKSKLYEHFIKIGRLLGAPKTHILKAYVIAKERQRHYRECIIKKHMMVSDYYDKYFNEKEFDSSKHDFEVLVLGHPYNIHDSFINMNLINKLKRAKIKPITYEMTSSECIQKGIATLPKKMFWTLGKNLLGCAYFFLKHRKIDGIIHVASFGCGPDSLVGELLERKIMRDYSVPFLYINLDEHSGEAGFNTRIEAFVDILEGRNYSECHVPTYG
jgi:predicted nucleotide-binding protein (sugar kinase/HSP70/actin superfamily)